MTKTKRRPPTKWTPDLMNEHLKDHWPNIYLIPGQEFTGNFKKYWFNCRHHGPYEMTWNDLVKTNRGCGCKHCYSDKKRAKAKLNAESIVGMITPAGHKILEHIGFYISPSEQGVKTIGRPIYRYKCSRCGNENATAQKTNLLSETRVGCLKCHYEPGYMKGSSTKEEINQIKHFTNLGYTASETSRIVGVTYNSAYNHRTKNPKFKRTRYKKFCGPLQLGEVLNNRRISGSKNKLISDLTPEEKAIRRGYKAKYQRKRRKTHKAEKCNENNIRRLLKTNAPEYVFLDGEWQLVDRQETWRIWSLSLITIDDRREMDAIYAERDRLNKEAGEMKYQVDHLQPLSKGGEHLPYNLKVVPTWWNIAKNNYFGEDDQREVARRLFNSN